MIKKLFLITLFSVTSIFAKEYMAQIKPYESFEIKAQMAGIVEEVKDSREASFVKDKLTIVKIDSKDERIDLEAQKDLLLSQEEIIKIREANYKAKKRIRQLSQYDKNNEKLNYLDSKKELVNTKKAIKTLNNSINKKTFIVSNKYIGEITAKKGEYLDVGDKVFDMYDISSLKITLYLTKKEIDNLINQTLFVNGKKSDFIVHKIYKTKDSVKVSRYKVEFIKVNKDLDTFYFDEVVKVELK